MPLNLLRPICKERLINGNTDLVILRMNCGDYLLKLLCNWLLELPKTLMNVEIRLLKILQFKIIWWCKETSFSTIISKVRFWQWLISKIGLNLWRCNHVVGGFGLKENWLRSIMKDKSVMLHICMPISNNRRNLWQKKILRQRVKIKNCTNLVKTVA